VSGAGADQGGDQLVNHASDQLLNLETRTLLDSLPDGVAVFGVDSCACYVNRVWKERRLVQRAETNDSAAPGSPDAVPEPSFNVPSQPVLAAALNRLRAGANEVTATVERTRPGLQSEAFELRLRWLPLLRPDAEDKKLILVQAHDITQQLRTERAHRETESLLSAIFETADVGLCLFDQRGRFVNVNRGYCELFGYRPEELVGRHYTKVLPTEEHEHAQRIFDRFMAGQGGDKSDGKSDGKGSDGRPTAVEARGRRKDGATIYVAMSTRLLIREDGRRCQVCSVIDITDRKEHARELEERASHARAEADQKTRLLGELDGKLDLIQHQHQQILDLSAPILDLWEGVLVLPVIGAFSAERASTVTERLLDAVVRRRARFVLLDLTSARDLESGSAEYIVRMISAVQLLGGKTFLTGLSSTTARTLGERGLDLSGVRAMRSLAEALRACLPGLR
jgi:rsbT co-antagonist protein RsbR